MSHLTNVFFVVGGTDARVLFWRTYAFTLQLDYECEPSRWANPIKKSELNYDACIVLQAVLMEKLYLHIYSCILELYLVVYEGMNAAGFIK